MSVFAAMGHYDYGELHFFRDAATGLRAVVAIHDTRLGPALGGCRYAPYPSEEEAIVDALRLARGMTYKAAIAGIPHGGGKAVLIRPEREVDRTAHFRAFGRFLENLRGHYVTAEDSGTSVEDMETLRGVTRHVVGVKTERGGSGDPSPWTALGVRRGIERLAAHVLSRSDLEGLVVAVQGVGHVGYHLCRELAERGARLVVADQDPLKAERAQRDFGAAIVPMEGIFAVECDVFAPCALGSALSDKTIPRLRCRIVAGAANNQLASPHNGDDLFQRGIVYAPDYAINAGGLINVAAELEGYDAAKVRARVEALGDLVGEIVDRASKSMTPTHRIADTIAQERLAKASERA